MDLESSLECKDDVLEVSSGGVLGFSILKVHLPGITFLIIASGLHNSADQLPFNFFIPIAYQIITLF